MQGIEETLPYNHCKFISYYYRSGDGGKKIMLTFFFFLVPLDIWGRPDGFKKKQKRSSKGRHKRK